MIIQGLDINGRAQPVLVDPSGRLYGNFPHTVLLESGIVVIGASGLAQNATTTLYTTPANRKAYLTSIFLNFSNQTAGANQMFAEVWNAVPALVFDWVLGQVAGGVNFTTVSLTTPYPLPAGYSFRIRSPALNLFARSTITGYELAA